MLKKRLIFVLYFDSGYFFLSRNFRLQKVGDINWLIDKFRFKTIGSFIDEIVILNVNRNDNAAKCSNPEFTSSVTRLMKENFIPLTIGGGVRSIEDAQRCFALGADKILLNSPLIEAPDFVYKCITTFGAQAVIGAIDVIKENRIYQTKIKNAQMTGLVLTDHIKTINSLGVGEVFLNSIERDGTGTGFDLNLLEYCKELKMPLILAGGAGKPEHFVEALSSPKVQAVATGHLFNFMGKGFESSRNFISAQGFPIRNI